MLLTTKVGGSVNLISDSIFQFPWSQELTPLSVEGNTLRLECELNKAKNFKLHSHRMSEIAWRIMVKDLYFSKCLLLTQPTPKDGVDHEQPNMARESEAGIEEDSSEPQHQPKAQPMLGKTQIGRQQQQNTLPFRKKKTLIIGITKNLNTIYLLAFKAQKEVKLAIFQQKMIYNISATNSIS